MKKRKKLERFGPPNWRAFSRAAGCAIAIGGGDFARADILYDATDMTDEQTYNHTYTSSITLWNGGWDRQLADDFEIGATYAITSVTGDFINTPPSVIPAEGFLVEFFSNETEKCVNGPPPCPSEIPFAQAFSASFTETPFEDTVFGNSGHRFMIDVSDSEIILGPGTWWISVVAVDESGKKSSLETWAILTTDGLLRGVPVHGRAGGQDHGNGYQGGELPDWVPLTFGGDEATPADAAIRIEGTLVEATTTTPDDFSAFRGFLASGTVDDVLESDDSDLCYEPGIVLNPTEAPVTLDFFGTLPNDSPSSLDVTIESSANTVGLELTISFWNFNTNSWDVVGAATQSLNADTVRTFAGDPVDHVEAGTGEVRTRYEVRQVSLIFLFPWLDCIDQILWTTTN